MNKVSANREHQGRRLLLLRNGAYVEMRGEKSCFLANKTQKSTPKQGVRYPFLSHFSFSPLILSSLLHGMLFFFF